MKNSQLDGRNAVITGASGGIGKATADILEQAGVSVLRHAHRTVGKNFLNADFSTPGESDRFVDAVFERLPKIDLWVNAAGVDLMSAELKHLSFDERLRRLMEVDVFATLSLSRRVGQRMKEQGGGTLVFFSWDGVADGLAGETAQLYGAAKGAVLGFCRSLAATLAPEVRVRCLSLGWIRTRWGDQASETFRRFGAEQSLLGRWGEPEDVAETVLWLVSPSADFVDGIDLRLNGGKKPADVDR